MQNLLKKIPRPLIIILLVAIIAVASVYSNLFLHPRKMNEYGISNYKESIKFAKSEEINIDNQFSHFPDEIPSKTNNARFFFRPTGANSICYLMFETTPEDMKGYLEYYQTNAEWIGKQSSEEAEKIGLQFVNFRNIGHDSKTLPDDYTLYMLSYTIDMHWVAVVPKSYNMIPGASVSGAAIDEGSNTIIIFCDRSLNRS